MNHDAIFYSPLGMAALTLVFCLFWDWSQQCRPDRLRERIRAQMAVLFPPLAVGVVVYLFGVCQS